MTSSHLKHVLGLAAVGADNATLNYLAIDIPKSNMQQQFEEPYCNFWAHAIPS